MSDYSTPDANSRRHRGGDESEGGGRHTAAVQTPPRSGATAYTAASAVTAATAATAATAVTAATAASAATGASTAAAARDPPPPPHDAVPMWVRTALGTLVAFAVAVLWDNARSRSAQRELHARCAAGAEADTIFVAIVGDGRPSTTADVIATLFERSTCPFRVFVGLYEPYSSTSGATSGTPAPPPPTSATLKRYEEVVRRHGLLPQSFADHVRVVAADVSEAGPYGARYTLLERAYGGQAYIATLPPDVEVAAGWDAALLAALRENGRLSLPTTAPLGTPPPIVLVVPPAPPPAEGAAALAAWSTATAAWPHGGFLRVHGFLPSGLPRLEGAPFAAPSPSAAVASAWWSSDALSFAPSAAWVAASSLSSDLRAHVPPPLTHYANLGHLCEREEDALVTAVADAQGWALLSPTTCLARRHGTASGDGGDLWSTLTAASASPFLSATTRGARAALAAALSEPSLAAALTRRGVVTFADAGGSGVRATATSAAPALGVLERGPLPLEATAKFGSVAAYTHKHAVAAHALAQAMQREAGRRRAATAAAEDAAYAAAAAAASSSARKRVAAADTAVATAADDDEDSQEDYGDDDGEAASSEEEEDAPSPPPPRAAHPRSGAASGAASGGGGGRVPTPTPLMAPPLTTRR